MVKPRKMLWETGVQNMVTELLEFKMLQESGLSDKKNRGACSDHASGMNERLVSRLWRGLRSSTSLSKSLTVREGNRPDEEAPPMMTAMRGQKCILGHPRALLNEDSGATEWKEHRERKSRPTAPGTGYGAWDWLL